MKSRHRNITIEEIEKAFIKAQNGENVYLGITDHDWREMSAEIDDFRSKLKVAHKKYPNVKFKFAETVEAFRNVIGYTDAEIKTNKVNFDITLENNILSVVFTNGEPFGPQPYLAIKTKGGDYLHDNFDFHEPKKSFSYVFDNYTITLDKLERVVVATNDMYGNQCIKELSFI